MSEISTMLLLFNKPYHVMCQFTDNDGRTTLGKYIDIKKLYPCGRLDYDSEGLLVLTDNGKLQHLISHPRHKLAKTYWVQVEGVPTEEALQQLKQGVALKDGPTAPAQVKAIDSPIIWPRTPPIRYRANIPTTWLEITIHEGRNRQVRRMTAAVGYPTLRLIRVAVGPWRIGQLAPGQWQETPLDFELLPQQWRKIMQTSQPRKKKRFKKSTKSAYKYSKREQ